MKINWNVSLKKFSGKYQQAAWTDLTKIWTSQISNRHYGLTKEKEVSEIRTESQIRKKEKT